MDPALPYCVPAPVPAILLTSWNLDAPPSDRARDSGLFASRRGPDLRNGPDRPKHGRAFGPGLAAPPLHAGGCGQQEDPGHGATTRKRERAA